MSVIFFPQSSIINLQMKIFVTAELGDFNPDEHRDGYLSEFRFVPAQDEEFEKEVAKHHQSHRFVKGQRS